MASTTVLPIKSSFESEYYINFEKNLVLYLVIAAIQHMYIILVIVIIEKDKWLGSPLRTPCTAQ
jgi:hypothetical protein